MAWNSYNLDRVAQRLVLDYRDKDVLNESHKMRVTVAYGLERFWGEHLRLINKPKTRIAGEYWRDTWNAFVKLMKKAGINVPNEDVSRGKTADIEKMVTQLWDKDQFPIEHQRIALTVLTQLCDSLVWWTQRYKKPSKDTDES